MSQSCSLQIWARSSFVDDSPSMFADHASNGGLEKASFLFAYCVLQSDVQAETEIPSE